MEPNNQYLNSTLDQINPSGRYYSSHTSQNTTISTLKQNLSYTNDSVNTTMSNYENLTSRNAPTPTMIYRKNYIKPKIPIAPSRNNNHPMFNKETKSIFAVFIIGSL